jgi:hypothetical protein
MSTYLEQIKTVASIVTEDELTKLRMEEELLILLARKNGISLDSKRRIMERIKEINRREIEILGG